MKDTGTTIYYPPGSLDLCGECLKGTCDHCEMCEWSAQFAADGGQHVTPVSWERAADGSPVIPEQPGRVNPLQRAYRP